MDIVYCDKCGFRIPEDELADGSALHGDGISICPKCRIADKQTSGKRLPRSTPDMGIARRQTTFATPPAAATPTRPPESQRLYHPGTAVEVLSPGAIIASLAGAMLLLGFVVLASSGSPPSRPVVKNEVPLTPARREIAYPDPAFRLEQENDASRAHVHVPRPEIRALKMLENTSEEDKALAELEQLLKFEGLTAQDGAARALRLRQFLKTCLADTLAASRARRLLNDLERTTGTKAPSVEAPRLTPVLSPGQELFKEDFDAGPCNVLGFGEVSWNLPGGALGKALKLKGGSNWSKGSVANWNAKGDARFAVPLPADVRICFTYFDAGEARDFYVRMVIKDKAHVRTFEHYLKGIKHREWTPVEATLGEFVDETGQKVPAGGSCCELLFGVYGPDPACFVDDIQVLGTAAAAPLVVVPTLDTKPRPPPQTPPDPRILFSFDFERQEALNGWEVGAFETKQTYGKSAGALKLLPKRNIYFEATAVSAMNVKTPFMISDKTVFSCAYYTTAKPVVIQLGVSGASGKWENIAWQIPQPVLNQWTTLRARMVEQFKTRAGFGSLIGAGLKVYQVHLYGGTANNACEMFVDNILFEEASEATVLPSGVPRSDIRLLQRDDKREGRWKKDLGRDGYVIYSKKGPGQHLSKLPPYIQEVSPSGAKDFVFEGSDARALEDPLSGGLCQPGTLLGGQYSVRIVAADSKPYVLSVYAADIDAANRAQRLELCREGQVLNTQDLSAFTRGVWLRYELTGPIELRVTCTGGPNALLAGLFFDRPVLQAAPGIEAWYEEFFSALRRRDFAGASARLDAVQQDKKLESLAVEVPAFRQLLSYLPELTAAAAKGALKLREKDVFELKFAKREPMVVGSRGAYKFVEVRNDSLVLDSEGMNVPVLLEALHRDTLDSLAVMGLSDSGSDLARRALLYFLMLESPESNMSGFKATIERAQAAGASAVELGGLKKIAELYTQRLRDGEQRESMAAAEWKEVVRLSEGLNFKQLLQALAEFKHKQEGTRVAAQRADELKALQARAEAMLAAEKGMVAWYKFDEASGTRAADASANRADATLSTGTRWVSGRLSKAVAFDGKESHVALPNTPALDKLQGGDYSLFAWYKPASEPAGKGQANNAAHAILMKQGWHEGLCYRNGARFSMDHFLDVEDLAQASSTRVFPPGNWYAVVGVVSKSEGQVRLYVNGVQEGIKTFPPTKKVRNFTDMVWRIGIAQPGATKWRWSAEGFVDEVRLYNRVLTDNEIRALSAPSLARTSPDK